MEQLIEIKLADAALFKENWKEAILEGRINPLDFYRQAKLFTEAIESLKKDGDILDAAFDEIAKYGKEKAVVNGSVISNGSKTTYDYSVCGDSVWNELKEKIAARERYLKALPAEGAVDPNTGSFINPPMARVSTFITVKA